MTRFSVLRKIAFLPFAVGMLFGIGGTVFGATLMGSARFSDIEAGIYFDGPVGRLVDQGVIKGFPDGTFHPTDFVTRADVAVMIDRAINGVEVEPEPEPEPEPEEEEEENDDSAKSSSSAARRSSSSKSSKSSAAAVNPDSGKFQFSATTFNVGAALSQASIVVQRVNGKTGTATVKYAFGGGTAVEGTDFQTSVGTLSFADGETSKIIKVTILKPGNPPSKTLDVTLSDPTGGAALGTNAKATLTLLASGNAAAASSTSSVTSTVAGAGTFSFSADMYGVEENAGSVTITVIRTGGSSVAAGISYATSNGTATSGTHYGAAQGTLAFAVGETSKTFSISVNNNATIDGNKTVNITLSTPTGGAGILSSKSVLTIVDEEANPSAATGSLLFSVATYTTLETGGTVKVTVLRQAGFTGTVAVDYATTDGSAVAGADYVNTTGRLTFAPGETSKTFYVPIATDTLIEAEESINLTLGGISGPATYGERQVAVIKIQ